MIKIRIFAISKNQQYLDLMLSVSEKVITITDFYQVVNQNQAVTIDKLWLEELQRSYAFLLEFSKDKIIYGVNTGFGPMAQHVIPREDINQLQYNLIRSHASGSGNLLDPLLCRAVVFSRMTSMAQGYSGVHPSTVTLLSEMLNAAIIPVIYEHGGVGASGDLVQLSHLALSMIGEGEVYKAGEIVDTASAMQQEGINPLKVHLREGLSLINGTSAMTGIGLINVIQAKKLLHWSIIMTAFLNEITNAYDDHHSAALNGAKRHSGQVEIAAKMRSVLSDSKLRRDRAEIYKQKNGEAEHLVEKFQEYYSIRCVPQVLGPIKDTIDHCEKILLQELNSANDNPIIDRKAGNVFHGGNFHGEYVSMEMDKLKIAVTKLSMLCERQINFLMNSKINDKLSPFINLGKLGLNFGLQGMQFTATSTTAENQTLSNPMSVHSIPTNNDNQDIVSMGTNSALMAKRVIDNTFEIMSIGMISVMQAVDYLDIREELSSVTRGNYMAMREIAEVINEDKARYKEMNNLKNYLVDIDFLEIIEQ